MLQNRNLRIANVPRLPAHAALFHRLSDAPLRGAKLARSAFYFYEGDFVDRLIDRQSIKQHVVYRIKNNPHITGIVAESSEARREALEQNSFPISTERDFMPAARRASRIRAFKTASDLSISIALVNSAVGRQPLPPHYIAYRSRRDHAQNPQPDSPSYQPHNPENWSFHGPHSAPGSAPNGPDRPPSPSTSTGGLSMLIRRLNRNLNCAATPCPGVRIRRRVISGKLPK